MIYVQKFGGTSLGDLEKLRRAAERTAALFRKGIGVVTVVSAQADTTDILLQQARQVSSPPPDRELDLLLSVGEQMSAALMSMTLDALGVPAMSFTGWQAGIHTDAVFGNARIQYIDPAPIQNALAAGRAVVVAGFQGISPDGSITTLGRGGSDTTAVALAAALHAERCRIYTDVAGVYDRDPRIFPDARRFERIGYDKMLTMARSGAQVLHDRYVELARDHRIPLEVLSAFTDEPGTLVAEEY